MRPKYLMRVLIIALFTIAGVDATNDISEVLGPFNISFSLPDDIDVTVDTVIEDGESYYDMKYTDYSLKLEDPLNSTHLARISVMQYESETWNLTQLNNMLVESMKGPEYITVLDHVREIDGRPGILVVGEQAFEYPERVIGGYLFDRQTPVVAESTLPWDGTSMMLNTIHVEKAT